MSQNKKRIQLSFLVKRTDRLLKVSLYAVIIFLGSFYLFGMNQVAMRGYLLTKEAQKAQEIVKDLESLESLITQLETKDYLVKQSDTSFMVYNDERQFLVYKERYTAQK